MRRMTEPPARDGDFFNQVGLGGGSRVFKSKQKEFDKRDKKNAKEAEQRRKKKKKEKTRKRHPK